MSQIVIPAVRLQPSSLKLSSRGVVTGVLYFAVDGGGFPDASWNDFVVVVLSWWCATLLKVASGAVAGEELCFMDGPFVVQLEASSEDRTVHVRFLRHDRLVMSGAMRRDELLSQVMTAGRQVLEFCERVGASGDDVEHLR